MPGYYLFGLRNCRLGAITIAASLITVSFVFAGCGSNDGMPPSSSSKTGEQNPKGDSSDDPMALPKTYRATDEQYMLGRNIRLDNPDKEGVRRKLVLRDNVYKLPKSLNYPLHVGDETVTFPRTDNFEYLLEREPGDIVISLTNSEFNWRRISEVTVTDERIQWKTESPSITEVIAQGSFHVEARLNPATLKAMPEVVDAAAPYLYPDGPPPRMMVTRRQKANGVFKSLQPVTPCSRCQGSTKDIDGGFSSGNGITGAGDGSADECYSDLSVRKSGLEFLCNSMKGEKLGVLEDRFVRSKNYDQKGDKDWLRCDVTLLGGKFTPNQNTNKCEPTSLEAKVQWSTCSCAFGDIGDSSYCAIEDPNHWDVTDEEFGSGWDSDSSYSSSEANNDCGAWGSYTEEIDPSEENWIEDNTDSQVSSAGSTSHCSDYLCSCDPVGSCTSWLPSQCQPTESDKKQWGNGWLGKDVDDLPFFNIRNDSPNCDSNASVEDCLMEKVDISTVDLNDPSAIDYIYRDRDGKNGLNLCSIFGNLKPVYVTPGRTQQDIEDGNFLSFLQNRPDFDFDQIITQNEWNGNNNSTPPLPDNKPSHISGDGVYVLCTDSSPSADSNVQSMSDAEKYRACDHLSTRGVSDFDMSQAVNTAGYSAPSDFQGTAYDPEKKALYGVRPDTSAGAGDGELTCHTMPSSADSSLSYKADKMIRRPGDYDNQVHLCMPDPTRDGGKDGDKKYENAFQCDYSHIKDLIGTWAGQNSGGPNAEGPGAYSGGQRRPDLCWWRNDNGRKKYKYCKDNDTDDGHDTEEKWDPDAGVEETSWFEQVGKAKTRFEGKYHDYTHDGTSSGRQNCVYKNAECWRKDTGNGSPDDLDGDGNIWDDFRDEVYDYSGGSIISMADEKPGISHRPPSAGPNPDPSNCQAVIKGENSCRRHCRFGVGTQIHGSSGPQQIKSNYQNETYGCKFDCNCPSNCTANVGNSKTAAKDGYGQYWDDCSTTVANTIGDTDWGYKQYWSKRAVDETYAENKCLEAGDTNCEANIASNWSQTSDDYKRYWKVGGKSPDRAYALAECQDSSKTDCENRIGFTKGQAESGYEQFWEINSRADAVRFCATDFQVCSSGDHCKDRAAAFCEQAGQACASGCTKCSEANCRTADTCAGEDPNCSDSCATTSCDSQDPAPRCKNGTKKVNPSCYTPGEKGLNSCDKTHPSGCGIDKDGNEVITDSETTSQPKACVYDSDCLDYCQGMRDQIQRCKFDRYCANPTHNCFAPGICSTRNTKSGEDSANESAGGSGVGGTSSGGNLMEKLLTLAIGSMVGLPPMQLFKQLVDLVPIPGKPDFAQGGGGAGFGKLVSKGLKDLVPAGKSGAASDIASDPDKAACKMKAKAQTQMSKKLGDKAKKLGLSKGKDLITGQLKDKLGQVNAVKNLTSGAVGDKLTGNLPIGGGLLGGGQNPVKSIITGAGFDVNFVFNLELEFIGIESLDVGIQGDFFFGLIFEFNFRKSKDWKKETRTQPIMLIPLSIMGYPLPIQMEMYARAEMHAFIEASISVGAAYFTAPESLKDKETGLMKAGVLPSQNFLNNWYGPGKLDGLDPPSRWDNTYNGGGKDDGGWKNNADNNDWGIDLFWRLGKSNVSELSTSFEKMIRSKFDMELDFQGEAGLQIGLYDGASRSRLVFFEPANLFLHAYAAILSPYCNAGLGLFFRMFLGFGPLEIWGITLTDDIRIPLLSVPILQKDWMFPPADWQIDHMCAMEPIATAHGSSTNNLFKVAEGKFCGEVYDGGDEGGEKCDFNNIDEPGIESRWSNESSAKWVCTLAHALGCVSKPPTPPEGTSKSESIPTNQQDCNDLANSQSDDYIRLVPAESNKTGYVWREDHMTVDGGFTTKFEFQLTDKGGSTTGGRTGADGLTFTLQNAPGGNKAVGKLGSGLGYEGVPNSLAVEFDTWANSYDADERQSPHGEAAAVLTGGEVDSSLGAVPLQTNIEDGGVHQAKISYDGGTHLEVYLDDMQNPILTVDNADLPNILNLAQNGGKAYVGFTASTGGAWANHDIKSWSYDSNNGGSFNYPNFKDISGLNFAGDAAFPGLRKFQNFCVPQPNDGLRISLKWGGNANLDLTVRRPPNSRIAPNRQICNTPQKQSASSSGGGENRSKEYVCENGDVVEKNGGSSGGSGGSSGNGLGVDCYANTCLGNQSCREKFEKHNVCDFAESLAVLEPRLGKYEILVTSHGKAVTDSSGFSCASRETSSDSTIPYTIEIEAPDGTTQKFTGRIKRSNQSPPVRYTYSYKPGIHGVTGGVKVIKPPQDTRPNQLESTNTIFVFPEQTDNRVDVSVDSRITENTDLSNAYAGFLSGGTISKRVNTYFAHYDDGLSGNSIAASNGKIIFKNDIIGIDVLENSMANNHAKVVGCKSSCSPGDASLTSESQTCCGQGPETYYSTTTNDASECECEPGPNQNVKEGLANDYVEIVDNRTLKLHFRTGGSADNIRIYTEP